MSTFKLKGPEIRKEATNKQTPDGTSWDQDGDESDLQHTPSLITCWFHYFSILNDTPGPKKAKKGVEKSLPLPQ